MTAARLLVALALVGAALAPGAQAQAPLTLVDGETTVASVGFAFPDGQTLLEQNLELQIATTAPPPAPFFGIFGGGADVPYPFDPIETTKDVVRLTRYYADSGFPLADVRYDVALDTAANAVDVTFVILEGPPLVVDEVSFAGPGQREVASLLAPELRRTWEAFAARPSVRTGDRLDRFSLVQLESQTIAWLRNRGYAWADAGAERFPDSTGLVADVQVKVNPGPRARVSEIRVEGNESLAASTVLREIPIRAGDRFDASALVEGQQEIFGLGLFSLALVDVAPDAVRGDTLVPIVVRLRRGPSRVGNGFLGYFSDGGLTSRLSFTHRNAFEGARQLGVQFEWRTGLFSGALPNLLGTGNRSVTGGPITDLRVSAPFRQPFVVDRRLSYTLQPAFRDRNDEIESSRTFEVSNTLLYTQAPLRTAALSLTGRTRDLSQGLGIRLLDAGAFRLPPGPFIPDTLRATTGVLGLDIVWSNIDNPTSPTRGVIVRPSAAAALGDVAYGRLRLAGSGTLPLRGRRSSVVVRGVLGGLFPGGGTSPDQLGDYVLFRDQLFYAGGTSDVRGWASARLGPKTFAVTPPVLETGILPDPSVITSPRDVNYVGIGGRYKGVASVQLNLPLASLGPQWGWNMFADAGGIFASSRVPTDGLLRAGGTAADSTLAATLDREGGLRIGVGAGIQYLTPVGFVSLSAGFKVNPSYLDLRDPAEVYCGTSISADPPEGRDDPVCFSGLFSEGERPEDDIPGYVDARLNGGDFDPELIPVRSVLGVPGLDVLLRRLQLHISIGQTF